MMSKRILKAILTAITFSLPALALVFALVELSGDKYAGFDGLQIGQTIAVEGKPLGLGGKAILAREIEIKHKPPEEKLKGLIEAINREESTLMIAGVKILVYSDTLIETKQVTQVVPYGEQDSGKAPINFSALELGQRVRVKGELRDDGAFDAKEIEVRKTKAEEEAEVEGKLLSIDRPRRTLNVLGFTIHVNPRAKIEFD